MNTEQKCSADSDLSESCSGCTDPRSEGTHQGCTKEHGHVGCNLAPTEQKCPYEDCPQVHYVNCPVHGSATHEHHFKGCTWRPNSHTEQKGWREDFRRSFVTTRGTNHPPYDMLYLIESFIERTLQSQREEMVKFIKSGRIALANIGTTERPEYILHIPEKVFDDALIKDTKTL